MQKAFHILFTTFYLLSFVGLTFNVHYCHGQIESVKVFVQADKCCCAGNEDMRGCCSDEQIDVQLEDTHSNSSNLQVRVMDAGESIHLCDDCLHYAISSSSNYGFKYAAQPPPKTVPLWLMYCSAVLYG